MSDGSGGVGVNTLVSPCKGGDSWWWWSFFVASMVIVHEFELWSDGVEELL